MNKAGSVLDIRLIHSVDQVIGVNIVLLSPGAPHSSLHGEENDDGGNDAKYKY